MSEEMQKYIEEQKQIYNCLMAFLENSEDNAEDFQKLVSTVKLYNHEKDREKFEQSLRLITDVANYYSNSSAFYEKIFHILSIFKEQINQTFTNIEIFKIFQSNKKILLFLYVEQIITIDYKVFNEIVQINEPNGCRYCHFFYPEIKSLSFYGKEKIQQIEEELFQSDSKSYENFFNKRHEGENESYICSLIRNDSIHEFVYYVTSFNIPLDKKIEASLFETNLYLIENSCSLIEYSAFFGSIKIFLYLASKVILKPSLWLFAIHSGEFKMIHFLEDLNINPPNNSYESCYKESIKCHHYEITDYFANNLLNVPNENEVISNIFCFHNYLYYPSSITKSDEFFYLCSSHCNYLAELYLNMREKSIIKEIDRIISHKEDEKDPAILYYLLLTQDKFQISTNVQKIIFPMRAKPINIYPLSGYEKLTSVVIPSSVTCIENGAFNSCKSLSEITIPSSVKTIGSSAFCLCSSLEHIEIPSSVLSIGGFAFSGCLSLKKVSLSASITLLENYTFRECKSLEQIAIPLSVTNIQDNVFNSCSSLKEIAIPPSVTSIGNMVFSGCVSLKKVTIYSKILEFWGHNCFFNCHKLEQVKFSYSIPITNIEGCIFNGCSKLKKIEIPPTVIKIGMKSFWKCSSLTEITLPSSITIIDNYAFNCCCSLQYINLPPHLTIIGSYAFSGCSSLNEIIIPPSVEQIRYYAFNECSSLKKAIILSNKLTIIKESLFYKCISLKEVTLPTSINQIKSDAFIECRSLTEITIPALCHLDKSCFSPETIIIRK
ncbi:hypothetical protein M9Y10_024516 [Tritrichomonas musculus]|uniref:Uncharacterized protein n=1 Tax=Tritrichomonas musculus TaxID=1915356 RepID=A0ABR2HCA4_9EUKA